MTVKNFLKTAVLGIALCSVLSISDNMACTHPDKENAVDFLQYVLDNSELYHKEILHDNRVFKSWAYNLSKKAQENDEIVKEKLLEIINIIMRALDNNTNNIIEQDITIFDDNMNDIAQRVTYASEHAQDIRLFRAYRAKITNELKNRLS